MANSSDDKQPQCGQPVHLNAAVVFGASVQLPTFDKAEPDSWFAIAEASFGLQKVTDLTTKYYYVLSKLDSTTLRKLSMFLKCPRGDDPYREIRNKLCRTYKPPLEQKLDALLSTNNIGDERPVEFGLELQRLLGNASTDDILKRIFLRSLPPSMVTEIRGSLSAKFEAVMEAADRAWTAAAASPGTATAAALVLAVSRPPPLTTRGGGCGGRGGHQRGSRSSAQ